MKLFLVTFSIVLISNFVFAQAPVTEIFTPLDTSYYNAFKKADTSKVANIIYFIPTFGFDNRARYKFYVNQHLVFDGFLYTDAIKGRTQEVIKIPKEKKIVMKIFDDYGILIFCKKLNKNYKTILLKKYPDKWEIEYTNNILRWD